MAAESEETKHTAVAEIKRSSLQMPRVVNRLNQLPIVNSLCEQVSGIYERTREKNVATQLGFSAAEVAMKAAAVTTRLAYSTLPSSGFAGKLKDGFEEKVSQVDIMACDGLEFLQSKWPLVKDETDKIMAVGAEKLEQSDLVEVLLTVTEAVVDYFKAPHEKVTGSTDPPVVQTKVDRIRGVSDTIMDGGAKVVSFATSAGLDGAKTAAQWSWEVTQSLLEKLPAILGGKQKLRRSKRHKAKGDYRRIVDASNPFPVSPDRKRKFDKEEGEGTLIEELIHVSENYVSDEDPDYVPNNDEEEETESSEDDDDDEADEGNEADEGEEEEDDSEAKKSEELETTSQASSQGTTQSKQTVGVNGVEKKEHGEHCKPNTSVKTGAKKKEVSPTKAAQLQQGEKKAELKITDAKTEEEKAEATKADDST